MSKKAFIDEIRQMKQLDGFSKLDQGAALVNRMLKSSFRDTVLQTVVILSDSYKDSNWKHMKQLLQQPNLLVIPISLAADIESDIFTEITMRLGDITGLSTNNSSFTFKAPSS